jgi:lactate 2-monooxygenase
MSGEDGDKPAGRPPYSDYLFDIYREKNFFGNSPPTTTDPNKLEAEARKAMTPEGFKYVFGGANEGATMDANRLAFRQHKFVQRMMRPAYPPNLKVELFGQTYGKPIAGTTSSFWWYAIYLADTGP